MTRILLAVAAVLLGTQAFGQTMTKAALTNYTNIHINSNGVGGVTGAILNTELNLIINSMCGIAGAGDCPLSPSVFAGLIASLPKCAAPCTVPPVATGQAYINGSGFVVIAQ